MKATTQDEFAITSIELGAEEPREGLDEDWFADRRSGSLSPPRTRTSSVAPMGDDDVDPWLR
jgi:hypothetical protein